MLKWVTVTAGWPREWGWDDLRLAMRFCSSALMPVLLTPLTWQTDESCRFRRRFTCRTSALASFRETAAACVDKTGFMADPRPEDAIIDADEDMDKTVSDSGRRLEVVGGRCSHGAFRRAREGEGE